MMRVRAGQPMATKSGFIRPTEVSYDGKKYRAYGEILRIRQINVSENKIPKKSAVPISK